MNTQDKLEAAINLVRACGHKVKGPFELKGPIPAGSGDLKKLDNDMIEHVDLYEASLAVGGGYGDNSYRVHVEMRRPYVIAKNETGLSKAPPPPTYTETINALFYKAVEEATALRLKRAAHEQELYYALSDAQPFQ